MARPKKISRKILALARPRLSCSAISLFLPYADPARAYIIVRLCRRQRLGIGKVRITWPRRHARLFAAIFNPGPPLAAMQSEIPKNNWQPAEGEAHCSIDVQCEGTEERMVHREATTPSVQHARQFARPAPDVEPDARPDSLAAAREAAAGCTRCPLYEHATQTVFGEGAAKAQIMFIGEQPGDQEDLAGKPFVGPAGRVLDEALQVAGIDRRTTYVTNAVKHFKFEPRGKRRIHQKPNAGEIRACRFWLALERHLVRPKLIVAMGATAVSSLVGRSTAVSALRGKATLLDDGTPMWVTVHPSFLLRMPDRNLAALERHRFEADLRGARDYLETLG
jgi:DNA polymerase